MHIEEREHLGLEGKERNRVLEAQIMILHMATLQCETADSSEKTIFCLTEYYTNINAVLIQMIWV